MTCIAVHMKNYQYQKQDVTMKVTTWHQELIMDWSVKCDESHIYVDVKEPSSAKAFVFPNNDTEN